MYKAISQVIKATGAWTVLPHEVSHFLAGVSLGAGPIVKFNANLRTGNGGVEFDHDRFNSLSKARRAAIVLAGPLAGLASSFAMINLSLEQMLIDKNPMWIAPIMLGLAGAISEYSNAMPVRKISETIIGDKGPVVMEYDSKVPGDAELLAQIIKS